jgi:uncharacterized protein (TIGR00730 family)
LPVTIFLKLIPMMKRICVFCGSSPGARPEYIESAEELGRALVKNGIGLVYGGARIGMMGAIASAVMGSSGEVIGVIPRSLVDKEVAYVGITDLRVVDSMHERKALMSGLSDGFIAMPGGLGTIEEIFEVLTWSQLGIQKKPCGFLNVGHYYDKLVEFIDHAVAEEFIGPVSKELILVDESPGGLLKKFAEYRPPEVNKAAWALQLASRTRKK